VVDAGNPVAHRTSDGFPGGFNHRGAEDTEKRMDRGRLARKEAAGTAAVR